MNHLALLYEDMADYARAKPLRLQAIEVEKKLGESSSEYACSLQALALLHVELHDYAAAEPLFRQTISIRKQVLGELHPDYVDSLSNLALLYKEMRDYARAEPLRRQAMEIEKKTLGETHPDYLASLADLADLYEEMGDYARAEPACRQALDIRKRTLGETHPHYVSSLNNLGVLYARMGDYARAQPLYRQAMEIKKKTVGETHPDYAGSLNNLASLYLDMGDYARAEPLCRQAMEIQKKALGEAQPGYARSLSALANLYNDMGDFSRAEPLCREGSEILKRTLGEEHPDYLSSLNNLALVYNSQADFARAEPLFQQVLEWRKKHLGEMHPAYADGLSNLGVLYGSMGDYARAVPLHVRALEIREKVLGKHHPKYAQSLANLALAYQYVGDFERVERLYRQAIEIGKTVLGDAHPDYAASLGGRGLFFDQQGDFLKGATLLEQALESSRRCFDSAAAVQSERQQLAMAEDQQRKADLYLGLAIKASLSAEKVYDLILPSKGAVFARQRTSRLLRSSNRPDVARLLEELQSTAARLAALVLNPAEPHQHERRQQQIRELSERKEHLEAELSRQSAEFRAEKAQREITASELRGALPGDAALVDFRVFQQLIRPERAVGKWGDVMPQLAAFVLRRHQPVVLLDLGPLKPIAAAAEGWRKSRASDVNIGTTLRHLLWRPLEPHLQGAKVVLISPEGLLNAIPFAALPGKQSGEYLIEEVTLAVVPVPQLLPELLVKREDESIGPPSMLLVGGVDFDAIPGGRSDPSALAAAAPSQRQRAGAIQHWNPLPGTDGEIAAIANSFKKATLGVEPSALRGGEAREWVVRREAAKHRYLHFATHGFFAPEEVPSALASRIDKRGPGFELFSRERVTGFHPGLLSGLVLAGANRPDPNGDDGVLTAMEIAELDLKQANALCFFGGFPRKLENFPCFSRFK